MTPTDGDSSTPKSPKRRVNLGATGHTVRANIARLRDDRRLTLRELSTRMGEAGRPLGHTAISDIENGSRRVDVDDLMAIASALGVAPNALLLPHGYDDKELVETTGSTKPMPLKSIYYFLEGMQTLDGGNNLDFAVQSLPEFMQIRRSAGRKRKSWNDPGQTWVYRALETDGNVVQWRIAESIESVLDDEDDDD